MVLIGIDWAEKWHDVCLEDEAGKVLASARVEDSIQGFAQLQTLIAEHAQDPLQVQVGIEATDGLMVRALRAAGYTIYPINPLAVTRYRDRHGVSKAKSDRGDARILAELMRTDRHNHRPLPDDSDLAAALKVLARAHKDLIWDRQHFGNRLRSTLRQFYPAALEAFQDRYGEDTLSLLERAPTPERGRMLSQTRIASAMRQARRRHVEQRAPAIQQMLRAPRLEQPELVAEAYGAKVLALVRTIRQLNAQIAELEKELNASFEVHPDAEIYLSLPGLGNVLGARVLAEFGDDPNRFPDGRARKNYAGSSPITRASGQRRVVLARFVGNKRLADTINRWAFAAISASPGARRYYQAHKLRPEDHDKALRALGNRLVGILDGCLRHHQIYREDIAWPTPQEVAAA